MWLQSSLIFSAFHLCIRCPRTGLHLHKFTLAYRLLLPSRIRCRLTGLHLARTQVCILLLAWLRDYYFYTCAVSIFSPFTVIGCHLTGLYSYSLAISCWSYNAVVPVNSYVATYRSVSPWSHTFIESLRFPLVCVALVFVCRTLM
jgi:hypothetical protein